jgi:hypothetical protein
MNQVKPSPGSFAPGALKQEAKKQWNTDKTDWKDSHRCFNKTEEMSMLFYPFNPCHPCSIIQGVIFYLHL